MRDPDSAAHALGKLLQACRRGQRAVGHRFDLVRLAAGSDPGVSHVPDLCRKFSSRYGLPVDLEHRSCPRCIRAQSRAHRSRVGKGQISCQKASARKGIAWLSLPRLPQEPTPRSSRNGPRPRREFPEPAVAWEPRIGMIAGAHPGCTQETGQTTSTLSRRRLRAGRQARPLQGRCARVNPARQVGFTPRTGVSRRLRKVQGPGTEVWGSVQPVRCAGAWRARRSRGSASQLRLTFDVREVDVIGDATAPSTSS
jgi:hypothetical protein